MKIPGTRARAEAVGAATARETPDRRRGNNAMSCAAAYDKLLAFGPRLDADLRREFGFVTELHLK